MVGKSMEFPSTPVIFVNKGGLYQCLIKNETQEVSGKVVTVRVDVGKYNCGYHFDDY